MAIPAIANGHLLWLNQMGNQDTVVDPGMTFYAPDILKMQRFIWQPVMGLHDVMFSLVLISMTGKANGIIICNGSF